MDLSEHRRPPTDRNVLDALPAVDEVEGGSADGADRSVIEW